MQKIKLIILLSFAAMIVSALVGIAMYYSYLEPFRVLASEQSLGDALDRVSYLEYTVTTINGSAYTVKVYNDPGARSGKAELYSGGSLLYTFEYTYQDNGLGSARLVYANGSVVEYPGAEIVSVEDYFLTSLLYEYDQQNASLTRLEPFPGIGPIYLPVFIGDRLEIDWTVLASITKTGDLSPIMEVLVGARTVDYLGKEVDAAALTIYPKVINPPNKWGFLNYELTLIADDGLAVAPWYKVDLTVPGQEYSLTFEVIALNKS